MWDGADKKQHIPNVQSVIAVLKQFILLLHPQIKKKWQYANLSTALLHRHHRFPRLHHVDRHITTITQAA